MSAKLPRHLAENTITDMEFDRTYYTVPWAMSVNEDWECNLHPDYPAVDVRFGTAQMRVELHEDGYHVWPVPRHRYSPASAYVGQPSRPWIPVTELHEEPAR